MKDEEEWRKGIEGTKVSAEKIITLGERKKEYIRRRRGK